jgi:hypothetical protein
MTGSDNVCYSNENKGVSGFDSGIVSTKLQPACAGESSDPCVHAQPCRAARVGLRGGRYRTYSPVEKFWARVEKTDGCWLFIGAACNQAGHRLLQLGRGARVYAHRFSYELHHGPIPEGLVVLHACDVPACVNPAHLRVGTQRDNVHDAMAKGRFPSRKHTWTVSARTVRRPRKAIAGVC